MAETARDRLVRMLSILAYVERHGATPFADLAAHFGVPVGRIREDVSTLWFAADTDPGWTPVEFSAVDFEEGVAALVRNDVLTQVRLSPREAVALVGALQTMDSAGALPDAGRTMLDKLRGALSEPVIVLGEDDGVDESVRDALAEAARRYRCVELVYVDAQDRRSTRVVEPHRIVVIDGHAYLECWCRRAEDYRTLRLDRIDSARVLADAVTKPPTDTAGFQMSASFTGTVRLARAGRWALEDIPGARVEDSGDDVTVTFGVVDPEWVAGRLLAIAPHLREIQPRRLADAVRREAVAVRAAHAR
ncbi:helix-turn-helix transcriptional regulator [Demequina pelophila]|uniref:helix-turn-helix transcriptional regulator n=1 Tax=Demequina pelophila TaxID=1638984 RepID=UPI000781A917|nr:WYL domain-containing protein [Demequina pelophila]